MLVIKSKSSGRYAASLTDRGSWTSDITAAVQFETVQRVEGFIQDVLACGRRASYDDSAANVQVIDLATKKPVKFATRTFDGDGPSGYGW